MQMVWSFFLKPTDCEKLQPWDTSNRNVFLCRGKKPTETGKCRKKDFREPRQSAVKTICSSVAFSAMAAKQLCKQLWKKKTINPWSESKEVQCLCLPFPSFQGPLSPRAVLATGPLKREKQDLFQATVASHSPLQQRSQDHRNLRKLVIPHS